MKELNIEIFEEVVEITKSIPEKDKAKVFAHIKMMSIDFTTVNTRLLKSPIKELKVKKYRIIFFIKKNTIYIVSCFIKKTNKTPLKEIQKAETIFKNLK